MEIPPPPAAGPKGLLTTTQGTYYSIPRDIIEGMIALVITDLHFNKHKDLSQSIPHTLKEILALIKKHNANVLFVLGDVIQGSNKKGSLLVPIVCHAFEQLPIPVYLIGGNHDRGYYRSAKYDCSKSNLKIIHDKMMLLEHPNPEPGLRKRVFLAHEMGNNRKLTDSQIPIFLKALKDTFTVIRPDDYLLTGHTHATKILESENLASVLNYSYDLKSDGYALITTGQHMFDISFGNISPIL